VSLEASPVIPLLHLERLRGVCWAYREVGLLAFGNGSGGDAIGGELVGKSSAGTFLRECIVHPTDADLEAAWNMLQHLCDIFTKFAQLAPAAGTEHLQNISACRERRRGDLIAATV
jgi:hypothetical protein